MVLCLITKRALAAFISYWASCLQIAAATSVNQTLLYSWQSSPGRGSSVSKHAAAAFNTLCVSLQMNTNTSGVDEYILFGCLTPSGNKVNTNCSEKIFLL